MKTTIDSQTEDRLVVMKSPGSNRIRIRLDITADSTNGDDPFDPYVDVHIEDLLAALGAVTK